MKKVVILGAGDFGREVLSFLQLAGDYKVIGFIDSDLSLKRKLINKIPVLGDDCILKDLKNKVSYAFVAISNSKVREILFKKICELGFEPINIIHPSAVIASNVSIGKGVIVYPNVTINTDVNIGNSVLINSNVSIGHDVEVRDFVNINPGVNIAGRVKIAKMAFLGIGCSILENILVDKKAIIGGGALVKKNVASEATVVGVPAQPTKSKLELKR